MSEQNKCLCGLAFCEPEKIIVCSNYHDAVVRERDRLVIEIDSLRAEVQRLSQIAQY